MRHTTCTFHCDACGVHFHSLESFDAHRQFDPEHPGDWDHRLCVHPLDDERHRWTQLTDAGVCDLARPTKIGVNVWTLGGSERLAALGVKRQAA